MNSNGELPGNGLNDSSMSSSLAGEDSATEAPDHCTGNTSSPSSAVAAAAAVLSAASPAVSIPHPPRHTVKESHALAAAVSASVAVTNSSVASSLSSNNSQEDNVNINKSSKSIQEILQFIEGDGKKEPKSTKAEKRARQKQRKVR